MIAAEPDKLRWRLQLAMEYRFVEEYEQLFQLCEESLAVSREMTGVNEVVAIGSFYAGEVLACMHLEKYEDALRVCEAAERDVRILELGRAFVAMEKADACSRLQKNEEAEDAICAYFHWKHELDINEGKQFIQGSAPFVGRAMDEGNVLRSYILRIDIAYRLLVLADNEDYLQLRERFSHFVQVTRDYQEAFPDQDAEELLQYMQAASTYMRQYAERTSSDRSQAEFEELKEKVLGEVYAYITKGQYAEALAILGELKKVNPTDLDIAEMMMQTRLVLMRQK
jgi:tetratricopeptide (TPR) repeat protein